MCRALANVTGTGHWPSTWGCASFCGYLTKLLPALSGASARLEGVNRPDLLPKEDTPLIDVAGFLTPGEVPFLLPLCENLPRTVQLHSF